MLFYLMNMQERTASLLCTLIPTLYLLGDLNLYQALDCILYDYMYVLYISVSTSALGPRRAM